MWLKSPCFIFLSCLLVLLSTLQKTKMVMMATCLHPKMVAEEFGGACCQGPSDWEFPQKWCLFWMYRTWGHEDNITWHGFFTVKLKSWLRCSEGVCCVHLFTTTHVMFGGVVGGAVLAVWFWFLIWLAENELVQLTPSSGIREATSIWWDWQHVDISSKRCDDSNIEHTLPQTNSKLAPEWWRLGDDPASFRGQEYFQGCQF